MQRMSVVPSTATIESVWELARPKEAGSSYWPGFYGTVSRKESGEEAICSCHCGHVDEASSGMGNDRGMGLFPSCVLTFAKPHSPRSYRDGV